MTSRVLCLALAGATLALGCSETHGDDEDAGGITFDPRFADAGTDAGPPPSSVGAPCADGSECTDEGGACIPPDQFPGGYCTVDCAGGAECPIDSSCVMLGGGNSLCLLDCDPSMVGADQCRAGYGCAGEGTEGVCFPGCEEDADCGAGQTCFPNANGGSCRTVGVEIGAACDGSSSCGEGQNCLSERRWGFPGGSCGVIFVDCDPDTDAGCPGDAACLEIMGGGGTFGICIDGCETDADCTRSGYECTEQQNGRSSYCGVAFDPANLGEICSADRGPCTGGTCLSETETGYPDSMCVDVGCDFAMQTGCPAGGVCVDVNGTGVCHPECSAPTDCRAGYDCAPAIAGDAMSPTACQPGCDDADVCGNPGATCNLGTGLCLPVLDLADLGEPCMDGEDCEGGVCLSEENAGWPAGTCALPGCRLIGTGPETTCPTDSVCVDDGRGDPELGVCNDACTMPTDCRPGYACTGGACVPGCTAGDCGSGRTCNTVTGLCE